MNEHFKSHEIKGQPTKTQINRIGLAEKFQTAQMDLWELKHCTMGSRQTHHKWKETERGKGAATDHEWRIIFACYYYLHKWEPST